MQIETDKQRMLDLLKAEYEFVHRTIDELSPETMLIPNVEGDWSIKDTLTHLTAWMRRMIGWLAEITEGKALSRPTRFTDEELAKINAEQWERDKDLLLEVVIADFRDTYYEIYSVINAIAEEDLFHNTFGGLIAEPIWILVKANSYEHFQLHIQPVRKWLIENHYPTDAKMVGEESLN